MPTLGSITKTVRINADDLRVFEDIMRKNGLSWSGAVHYLVEHMGIPQKQGKMPLCVPKKSQKEVNGGVPNNPLLKLSEELHIPYETFCSEIIKLTDSGELMEERGCMVVHENGLDISEYLTVCKDIGKDAQKCLDGFTESLRKGNRST